MKFVKGCSHEGILSTGVANPESKNDGSKTTNAPSIACCCVFEIAEIKSPTPDIENKKVTTLRYKSQIDPLSGTLKK